MSNTQIGTVKWFDEKKGFGFISLLGPDPVEIFVHYTSIIDMEWKTLIKDTRVQFETVQTDAGLKAQNVKVIL